MRVLVIGATGGIGGATITQGLERGHELTALVRSPEKITVRHERLRVEKGDPLSADAQRAVMAGQDAVISSLGARSSKEETLMRDGARATIDAMRSTGVQRLLMVSAAMLFDGGPIVALVRRILAVHARDLVAMEALVRASGLQWTLARPPRLTNGVGTGHYRAAVEHMAPRAFSMPRADVARYLLDALEQRTHIGAVVGLAK